MKTSLEVQISGRAERCRAGLGLVYSFLILIGLGGCHLNIGARQAGLPPKLEAINSQLRSRRAQITLHTGETIGNAKLVRIGIETITWKSSTSGRMRRVPTGDVKSVAILRSNHITSVGAALGLAGGIYYWHNEINNEINRCDTPWCGFYSPSFFLFPIVAVTSGLGYLVALPLDKSYYEPIYEAPITQYLY